MPQFRDSEVQRITLPSYEGSEDPAWVDVRTRNLVKDVEGIDSNMSQLDLAIELLSRKITAWNFTDTDGSPLPVSKENIRRMEVSDLTFLGGKIVEATEDAGLPESKKDDSSSTS